MKHFQTTRCLYNFEKKINFMELLQVVSCLLMPGYILEKVKDLQV